MNKYMYGYVHYGDWDGEVLQFIKINKEDKEKFIEYCNESLKIKSCDGERLKLLGFVDNIEIYDDNMSQGDKYSDIMTIQQHQNELKDTLEFINKNKEEHRLYKQRDLIQNLLNYEFLD